MTIKKTGILIALLALAIVALLVWQLERPAYTNWSVYSGGEDNIKYSSLHQIDTANVTSLRVAWTYHAEGNDSSRFGPMECNPIVIGNTLYGVSARMKLFAINAGNGSEKWSFNPADPVKNPAWQRSSVNMSRGVAYWEKGKDKRIIYTVGPVVLALNAETGQLIREFGKEGGIDLRKGLDRPEAEMSVSPTSPVMVYKDLFIVCGAVSETTPGHIRAFDIRTGKQVWIFHTIPYPGEPGYETWDDSNAYKKMGSANAWSGFSLDSKKGVLFAGIGSPTNDFYGGDRAGKGLYGNCVVALDASSGKLIWHFQAVHHDVWDMDVSSPPALVTINKDGKRTEVVVQTTKTGLVFILNRKTGLPVFPVEERKVPVDGAVSGEQLSPTQPFPVLPLPFVRTKLTASDLNRTLGDSSYQDLKRRLGRLRSEGIYTPPTEQGTIVFPGYDGGANWGGPSVDPETNILYINANEMAWVLNLVRESAASKQSMNNLQAGALLYRKNCMGCHGPERLGAGDYPSLIGVNKKYTLRQFTELLSTGRRMMPGFSQLKGEEKQALAALVLENLPLQQVIFKGPRPVLEKNARPAYTFTGYNKFLSKEGYPAISPPWGTISAINLNTGQYEWKIPLGEFEELKKKGIAATGRENFGGTAVTAGGLLFVGASADGKFRAIHKRTGKILWETNLPAAGMATPAVYSVNGRQYVVIACGGSKSGGKSSDAYVAFTL